MISAILIISFSQEEIRAIRAIAWTAPDYAGQGIISAANTGRFL